MSEWTLFYMIFQTLLLKNYTKIAAIISRSGFFKLRPDFHSVTNRMLLIALLMLEQKQVFIALSLLSRPQTEWRTFCLV